jgi:hypothetical protein
MSYSLRTIYAVMNTPAPDVNRIATVLAMNDVSTAVDAPDLTSAIIDNPLLLNDPVVFEHLRSIVARGLGNDENSLEIRRLQSDYESTTYELGMTTFPVAQNDPTRTPLERSTGVVYSHFGPRQPLGSRIRMMVNKPRPRGGQQANQDNYEKMAVDFDVFALTRTDDVITDGRMGYKFRAVLRTDGYRISTNAPGQRDYKLIVMSLMTSLGVSYISDVSEISLRDNVITINTYSALRSLVTVYNDYVSKKAVTNDTFLGDYVGRCYFDDDGTILVPEFFKLYMQHVTELIRPETVEFDTAGLETELQPVNTAVAFANRYVPDSVALTTKGTKVRLSFRRPEIDSHLKARVSSGSIKFVFGYSQVKKCEEYVESIMKRLRPFSEYSELANRIDYRVSGSQRGNNRSGCNVYVNFTDVTPQDTPMGFEDRIFRTEYVITEFLRSLTFYSNDEPPILYPFIRNDVCMTESYIQFKLFGAADLKPESVTYSYVRYPDTIRVGQNDVSVVPYITGMNKVTSALLPFVVLGRIQDGILNYTDSRVFIVSPEESEAERSSMDRSMDRSSADLQLRRPTMEFENAGFRTDTTDGRGRSGLAIENTTLKWTRGAYEFRSVNANPVYVLRSGSNDIEVYLVKFELENPPVLTNESDAPLRIVRLSDASAVYIMSRLRPNLEFVENAQLDVRGINVNRNSNRSRNASVVFANPVPLDRAVLSRSTLVRFYLESLNYEYTSIFDELAAVADERMPLEDGIGAIEQTPFTKRLLELVPVYGLNEQSITMASTELLDKNYWIRSLFLNMYRSMKQPVFTADYPVITDAIVNTLAGRGLSADAGTQITLDYIRDLAATRSVNDFTAYVSVFRSYLNRTLIKDDIIAHLTSEFPNTEVLVKEFENSYSVLVPESVAERIVDTSIVLEHSGVTIVFSADVESVDDSPLNPDFDAVFSMETNADVSDDSRTIADYLRDNVRYESIDDEIVPKNYRIQSVQATETGHRTVFGLPFEDRGYNLIVNGVESRNEDRTVRLVTPFVSVTGTESPIDYLEPESPSYPLALATGLTPLMSQEYVLPSAAIKTAAVFEIQGTGVVMRPTSSYGLYAFLLQSPKTISLNTETARSMGTLIEREFVPADVLTKTNDTRNDDVIIGVSSTTVVRKNYGGMSLSFPEYDSMSRAPIVGPNPVGSNPMDRLRISGELQSLAEYEREHTRAFSQQNMLFASGLHPDKTEVDYRTQEYFLSHAFSEDRSVLVGVSDSAVRVFLYTGRFYCHTSTLNVSDVASVVVSSLFVVTTSKDLPSVNRLWIATTGDELNVELPGYDYRRGDVVSGTVVNDMNVPVLDSRIRIDRVEDGRYFAERNREITNITGGTEYNRFFFSKDNAYLVYNNRTRADVLNLKTMTLVNLTGSPSLMSTGEWRTVDGVQKFFYVTPLRKNSEAGKTSSVKVVCIIPSTGRVLEMDYNAFKLPTVTASRGMGRMTMEPDPEYAIVFNAADVYTKTMGVWLFDVYVYVDNNRIVFAKGKTASSYAFALGTPYFDNTTVTLPEDWIRGLFESVSVEFSSSTSVFQLIMNGNALLNGTDVVELPVVQIGDETVFVTSFNDEAVCVGYTNEKTTISRYGRRGFFEYTITGRAGVARLNNELVVYVYNTAFEFTELKRPAGSYGVPVQETEFEVRTTETFPSNSTALVTNRIVALKYAQPTTDIPKSIDDYPISSCLSAFRCNDYKLVRFSGGRNNSIEHGNLLLFANGRELRIIPRIVQQRNDLSMTVLQEVQDEFLTKTPEEFRSRYNKISAVVNKIQDEFPELNIVKEKETDVYRLICPDGPIPFDLAKSYELFADEIVRRMLDVGLTRDDYRHRIIRNPENFRIMRAYFCGSSVNEVLLSLYEANSGETEYRAISEIVPEAHFIRRSTFDLFKKADYLVRRANEDSKREEEIREERARQDRYRRTEPVTDNNSVMRIKNGAIDNMARGLKTITDTGLETLFSIRDTYEIRLGNNGKFDILPLQNFATYRDLFVSRVNYMNSMRVLMNETNTVSDMSLDELRSSIRNSVVRYYGLSKEFLISRTTENPTAMAVLSLTCQPPLVYSSDEITTEAEVSALEDELVVSMRVPVTMSLNLAAYDHIRRLLPEVSLGYEYTRLVDVVRDLMSRYNGADVSDVLDRVREPGVTTTLDNADTDENTILRSVRVNTTLRFTVAELIILNSSIKNDDDVMAEFGFAWAAIDDAQEKAMDVIEEITAFRRESLDRSRTIVSAVVEVEKDRKTIEKFLKSRLALTDNIRNEIELAKNKLDLEKKDGADITAELASLNEMSSITRAVRDANVSEFLDRTDYGARIRRLTTTVRPEFIRPMTSLLDVIESAKAAAELEARVKSAAYEIQQLEAYVGGGRSMNEIIRNVVNDLGVEKAKRVISAVYEGREEFSTKGLNTTIRTEFFPPKAKVNDGPRVKTREEKGKLQGGHGYKQGKGSKSSVAYADETNEDELVKALPVYSIPVYLTKEVTDEDGYRLMKLHRNTYRVYFARDVFGDICNEIRGREGSDIVGLMKEFRKRIRDMVTADVIERDVKDPIQAFKNLIRQEVYYDTVKLIRDITDRGIVSGFVGLAELLDEIGEVVFGNSLRDIVAADRSRAFEVVEEATEYARNNIETEGDLYTKLRWFQEFMTGMITTNRIPDRDERVYPSTAEIEDRVLQATEREIQDVIETMDDVEVTRELISGMAIIRNPRTITSITQQMQQSIDAVCVYSQTYGNFMVMKYLLASAFNFSVTPATPISSVLSSVSNSLEGISYDSTADALKWYIAYGESPLVNDSVPREFLNYHIPSLLNSMRVNLFKIATNQYRTTEPTEDELRFRNALRSLSLDYAQAGGSDERYVNELCITFKEPVRISPKHVVSSDELTPINLEFIVSDVDTLNTKTFTISLMDVLENAILGSEDEFLDIVRSTLKQSNVKLASTDSIVSELINNQTAMPRQSSAIFSVIPIVATWEIHDRLTGIQIGNRVYPLTVYSRKNYAADIVYGMGTDDFGYNGLQLITNPKTLSDVSGGPAVYRSQNTEEIVKYFNVQGTGKVLTAFEFQNIKNGNRRIIVGDNTYNDLTFKNNSIYTGNTIVKTGAFTTKSEISRELFMKAAPKFVGFKVQDDYVAVCSTYSTDTNQTWSTIGIAKLDSVGFRTHMNIVLQDLVVRDFNFLAPSSDYGGSLTIAGTQSVGGNYSVRVGEIVLPKTVPNGGGWIVNSFDMQLNFAKGINRIGVSEFEERTFSQVQTLELKGYVRAFVRISGRKNGKSCNRIVVWDAYGTTVNEAQLTQGFPERIDSFEVSRTENYYAVVSGDNTSVYSVYGSKVDNIPGSSVFL